MEKNIHVVGIDPGGTTGWCRLTIPRAAMFEGAPSRIVEWDYGVFSGAETEQVKAVCRLAREIQGLAYGVGPALVVEDWDSDPSFKSTDPEALSPVRIGAMLRFAHSLGADMTGWKVVGRSFLGDSTLTFQGRTIAKSTATDERLKAWGLWSTITHTRDATRHAIVALRRARQNEEMAAAMWPAAARYRVAE